MLLFVTFSVPRAPFSLFYFSLSIIRRLPLVMVRGWALEGLLVTRGILLQPSHFDKRLYHEVWRLSPLATVCRDAGCTVKAGAGGTSVPGANVVLR